MHSTLTFYCPLKPRFSEYQAGRQNETERESVESICKESQHALCSLLSHSAHWPSATPQWCKPSLAFLLASIGRWMRKNDCDISYRFHIKASGSNAPPDTLISILVVTGEHKRGEACSALKNEWGVLFKWLPVHNLMFFPRLKASRRAKLYVSMQLRSQIIFFFCLSASGPIPPWHVLCTDQHAQLWIYTAGIIEMNFQRCVAVIMAKMPATSIIKSIALFVGNS